MQEQKVFPFRARLDRRGAGPLRNERTGWLTPYEVETLYSDAVWAGQGARLEVSVPARTTEDGLAWVRSRFDRLRRRGIGVRVERDEGWEFRDVVAERRS